MGCVPSRVNTLPPTPAKLNFDELELIIPDKVSLVLWFADSVRLKERPLGIALHIQIDCPDKKTLVERNVSVCVR